MKNKELIIKKTEKKKKTEEKSKTNKTNKIKKIKGGNDFADLGSSIGYTLKNGFNMAKTMIIEIGAVLNMGRDFKNAVNPNMSNATPGNSVYTGGPTSSLPDVSGM